MPDRRRSNRTHHARYALRALGRALDRSVAALESVGTVVDYGCGDQPYRSLFEDRGGRYIGVDLATHDGAELVLTEDGEIPLADATADIVLSTQVLEHVPDPVAYLAEARRVLRPDGHLLLSTHGVWHYHPHPDDYWRWTASGLQRLLRTSCYEVRSLEGVMNCSSAGLQLWQDALLARIPTPLHWPLILLMQPIIGWHDRAGTDSSRSRDAAIYVVCARRVE